MKTLEKIAKVGFVALLAAGLAGCAKIEGEVVNISGEDVRRVDNYYNITKKCQNLDNATSEEIVACRENTADSILDMDLGDLTFEVKTEDGTLYYLIIVNNREYDYNTQRAGVGRVGCETFPHVSDIVRMYSLANRMHYVRFPDKDRFNEFNVGDYSWCELEFFEKEAE